MAKFLEDGNVVGRLGAVAFVLAAGLLVRKLAYGPKPCPLPEEKACCRFMNALTKPTAPPK